MTISRRKEAPRSGKIVTGFALILAILLVIVFTDLFFADGTGLRFFLI